MSFHAHLESAVTSARGALEAAESRLVMLSDAKHEAEERSGAATSKTSSAELLKLRNGLIVATDTHAAAVREHAAALASLGRAESALEDARSLVYTAAEEKRRAGLLEACMVHARRWWHHHQVAEAAKLAAAEAFPALSAEVEAELQRGAEAWGPGAVVPMPDPSAENPNAPRTLDECLRAAMRETGARPMDPRGQVFDIVARAHAAFAADSEQTSRRQREAKAERTNARSESPLSEVEQARLGYVLATEGVGFGLLGSEVVSLGLDADHALAMAGADIVRNGAPLQVPDDPRIIEAVRVALDGGAYERASIFRLPLFARSQRQSPPSDEEVSSWWGQELRSRGGAPRPVRADDATVRYIPFSQLEAIPVEARRPNLVGYDPEAGPPPMVAP